MKVNQYCVILQIFHQENLAGIIFHAFTISYKSIFHMLCMARWLADYANPTKREFTSPIATILIETIKRWRENVKKGVKNKFVCLGFMRSGMKRFLMWRSIHFCLIWMVWTPIILGLNTSIKFLLHCCLKEQKVNTHGKTREAVFIRLNVQKICNMQWL